MKSVAIWGLSNYNWLWVPMANKFKKDLNSEVHFICSSKLDMETWKKKDKLNSIDSFIEIGNFMKKYDEVTDEFESIVKKAKIYEERYNVLAVDVFQSDRHLGRGYSAGGPGHPHSKLSRKSSFIKSLNCFNLAIEFWEDYFEKTKPSVVVGVISGIVGKTCAVVARGKEIEIRALNFSRYQSNFYWTKDEYYTFPEVKDFFDKNKSYYGELAKPEELDALKRLPWSEKNYQKFKQIGTFKGLFKKTIICLRQNLVRFFRKVEVLGHYTFGEQLKAIYNDFYAVRKMTRRKYVTKEDLENKEFVFFPLHVEPESALSLLNPEFNEQMAIVQMLAKNLPAGVTLVLKDHIGSLGRRPKEFYKTFDEMPNVELAAPYDYALNFVRGAKAVAVITGTVGTESIILGVPVISFGVHNSFNFLPDVYPVTSWMELKPLLKKLCEAKHTEDDKLRLRENGLRYIAATKEASFDLNFSDYTSKNRVEANEKELELIFGALVASVQEQTKPSERTAKPMSAAVQ